MHYKDKFGRPRPSQLEPALRPTIDIPGHASYPSGHATQSFLTAKALAEVVHNHEVGFQLSRIAEDIAANREWAGVHYESDSMAGRRLATELFPLLLDVYAETFEDASQEWL
jgi:membrane-associated phospholipid phosphatase